MFRKASVLAVIVMGGGLGRVAWNKQQPNTFTTDDHGASLIEASRKAFDRCDTDAFLAQIYTGNTQEGRDLSAHRSMFEMDCRKHVDSITIAPLDSTDVTTYSTGGVQYRPTRPPTGKLVIHFASQPGASVHDEVTTFLVGRAKQRWWILTAEPDR